MYNLLSNKLDVEIGYVKNMIKISWGLWVFHNKGLAVYAAASTLQEARDRCLEMSEGKRLLEERIKPLEEDVARAREVEESLENQLTTLSERLKKVKTDLADAKDELSEAKAQLEEAKKGLRDTTKATKLREKNLAKAENFFRSYGRSKVEHI